MIVGMNGLVGSAPAAQRLVGEIGDNLVDVHVGLRARPGLIDDERKFDIVFPHSHLLGGRGDSIRHFRRQEGKPLVDPRRRLLDQRQRVDNRDRHGRANAKILQGALRLGAPIAIDRHIDRAEAVMFAA